MTQRKPQSSTRGRSTHHTEYRLVCPRHLKDDGPASSRAVTSPEIPAAKDEPSAEAQEARRISERGDGRFEVWCLDRRGRTYLSAFLYLNEALDDVHARDGGRYDIRLPNGKWFSEIQTIRTRSAQAAGSE